MAGKKMVGIALAISLVVSAVLAFVILLGPTLNLDQILSFLGQVETFDGGKEIPDRIFVGIIKGLVSL